MYNNNIHNYDQDFDSLITNQPARPIPAGINMLVRFRWLVNNVDGSIYFPSEEGPVCRARLEPQPSEKHIYNQNDGFLDYHQMPLGVDARNESRKVNIASAKRKKILVSSLGFSTPFTEEENETIRRYDIKHFNNLFFPIETVTIASQKDASKKFRGYEVIPPSDYRYKEFMTPTIIHMNRNGLSVIENNEPHEETDFF